MAKALTRREALVNLALYGYGVVRNIKGVAVTLPTNFGVVILSNEAFSKFLELEFTNDKAYRYEKLAEKTQL